jgi:ABC-2 type transport system ATP-binding protein
VIEVKNLFRKFGDFVAVNDLSFSVKPGEVLGFLGPNGAGKSTTMKMITGFISPSNGEISIFGHDIVDDSLAAKKLIGYLPEGAPSYGEMTVFDFLRFVAEARGIEASRSIEAIAKVVAQVELKSVLHKPIDNLSKGYKRRVGLAQAIIHDPKVLILDEPTDGLDPNQKHQVRRLIQNMSSDKIIIISTHILEEVTAVCTRAMIINNGQLVVDGTPNELIEKSTLHGALTVSFSQPLTSEQRAHLAQSEWIERVVDQDQQMLTLIGANSESLREQFDAWVAQHQLNVKQIFVEKGSLDDVFRNLTTGASS